MELRQLKYFTSSAEMLNFTEAAKSLFISQSTLSQQIKQLEEELGILLFDRIGKTVRLTEAGKLFLPYARQTIIDAESGKQIIEDLKELMVGEMRVGATYGLSALLIQTIIVFSKKYPQIKIIVEFGTSEELLEKLKAAKIDFLLSFLQIQNRKLLESQTLFTSPLSLVFHSSHQLTSQKSVGLKDLENIPLALPGKGFNTRKFLDEVFEKRQIKANVKMELNDINNLLNLVETGNWCTIMTVAAMKGRSNLKTIPIKNLNNNIQASITWLKDAYRKKAVIVFTEMMKKQVEK
jgi:LysR family transcriptional regulator, cyn operon transcriptional activator